MKYPIVPACIPKTREHVLQFTEAVSFAHEIQIDVTDGRFVSGTSWPYEPSGEPKTIAHATDAFTLEVDLMVDEPIVAAKQWLAAGADMLVFHVESLPLSTFSAFVERCPVSVGVACHGQTDLEYFFSYVAYADYVQLMGIREIGKQGEPFDTGVLQTIAAVRERFPKLMISIDGSVNETTITQLRAAGADRFVAGSAIVGAEDPQAAYQALAAAVH